MVGIKHRNPGLVLLFTIITLGIYGIYWIISTTNELRRNTTSAPNPLLWLVILLGNLVYISALFTQTWILAVLAYVVILVIVIVYWWKYSTAINELTGFSKGGMFALLLFVAPVGMILAQIELNKKAD